MNQEIDIVCDRCGSNVHGVIIQEENVPKMTGGFYDVTAADGWHEFAREGEQNICDLCMWQDPQFLAKYPENPKIPHL
jgi:hypothetical protein